MRFPTQIKLSVPRRRSRLRQKIIDSLTLKLANKLLSKQGLKPLKALRPLAPLQPMPGVGLPRLPGLGARQNLVNPSLPQSEESSPPDQNSPDETLPQS